jgi:hypothetical protein
LCAVAGVARLVNEVFGEGGIALDLGWRNMAAVIAPSASLAWAFALWPFGVGACVAGAVCGAVAGVFGARPLARLADRASAEGGILRRSATAAVLVALWLALVIVPAVIGGLVRSHS